MSSSRLTTIVEQLWLPALLVFWWWVASADSQSVYFPPLRDILVTLWQDLTAGPLPGYIAVSLLNMFVGLLIAVVVGVGAGLLIGQNERLRSASGPTLSFLRAIPPAAIVPIVILAMGVGSAPKITIIGLGCVWPVLLNTVDGVRGISPAIWDTVRAFRIRGLLATVRVALPAASPQIMAGIRIALSVALVLMVISEFFAADSGLGFYIANSSQSFALKKAWAGTLLVGAIGYVLSSAFLAFERWLLAWYLQTSLNETAAPTDGLVGLLRIPGLKRKEQQA